MCPAAIVVKSEEVDGVIGLPSPTCGDTVGATAEKRAAQRSSALPSPPPTPSKLRIKREDPDDILADLHRLFDELNVNDSKDSNEESDSGSDTAPPSPLSRGFDFLPKTCFFVGPTTYSYDEDRNVYREDANGNSTLIRPGETGESLLDMINTFCIGDITFQFDISGQLHFYNQESWCLVSTWPQPSLDFHPFDRGLGTDFNFDGFNDPFQSSRSFEPAFGFQPLGRSTVTSGLFPDSPQAKKETEERSNPLNNSLQGTVPWSPGSSAQSPIVSSTSRATSEAFEQPLITKTEYPLFQPKQSRFDAEQDFGFIAGVQLWKHETSHIQAARSAPASDKMDRRRCPECNKVFRRPSSLEDHLNVHTGKKPHVCPFERCKTGFATKSNMKRHFTTHRAGTLEEYLKSGKVGKEKARTATYNAKAFHTQRFRLT